MRKRLDDVSYTIRFTPRRAGSNWSSINIRRVGELDGLGLCRRQAWPHSPSARSDKSRIYVYERRHTASLAPEHQKKLEGNRKAWAFSRLNHPATSGSWPSGW